MADDRTDLNRINARKRQEAALKKQMQYINSLSPEDREKIYEIKHKEPIHIAPKTFKQKISNFWYHYKAATIGIVAAVGILSFFVYEMVSKEKYDIELMLASTEAYSADLVEETAASMSPYASDYDENGKVNISIVNVQMGMTVEEQNKLDPNYYTAQFVKFSAGYSEAMYYIYIFDQANYDLLINQGVPEFEDLTQYSDNPNIEGDKYYIKDDPILGELDQGNDLFLCIRTLDSLPDSDKEDVQKDYENQLEFVKNILNQTPVSDSK
jgi:hypothetical protein